MDAQTTREFIDIPLRPATMFYYVPRTSILRAVRESATGFYGEVLDVGCGFMPYRDEVLSIKDVTGYTGMDLAGSDIYGKVNPDIVWEGTTIPLGDASVDCIMATEFIEHHSFPEAVLAEMLRVLKPGGMLFATVPFVWNLHEIPHDEYRYTPYSLERIVTSAGFGSVSVRGLGGWNAAMAQFIGLWITFAKLPDIVRTVLRYMLFPVFVILVKTDEAPREFDGDANSMFTGLCLTARK